MSIPRTTTTSIKTPRRTALGVQNYEELVGQQAVCDAYFKNIGLELNS